MEMKKLMRESAERLEELRCYMIGRDNTAAAYAIALVQEFAHKRVRVVKGRKVPLGTEGVVFWMGSHDYSRYGDPWGIYTSYRAGIRADDGTVYWTAVDNIEVV